MKLVIYDILAKAIAAYGFAASSLKAAVQQCQKMCGCVTFREIFLLSRLSEYFNLVRKRRRGRTARDKHRDWVVNQFLGQRG